jgi:predicted amidohydrolase
MKDIRVAVAVTRSPVGKPDENLEAVHKWVQAAKKKEADLICFPEMNITGYDHRDAIRDSAQPIPGPISHALVACAAEEGIVILAGLAEKAADGRVFATHLVVQPNGEVGIYRKLHIAPVEKPVYSAGSNIPMFHAAGVTFGVQLCYDAHFPELSTQMAINGAEILFVPHASPRGSADDKYLSWMRHLPARAYDNGFFIVACNQTGDNGQGVNFPGVAVVIDPSGRVLLKTTSDREELLVADISSQAFETVHNHPMRYFLPNRRPELYGQ